MQKARTVAGLLWGESYRLDCQSVGGDGGLRQLPRSVLVMSMTWPLL
jgi:hypothetical protein